MKRTYHILLWGVVLGFFALAVVGGPAAADDDDDRDDAEHLQSWSQRIDDGDDRFEVLDDFNDEAVLDKETQLVWEQSPRIAPDIWFQARFICVLKNVGGRLGWRLPSLHELASLMDPTQGVAPPLSPDHPFSNVQASDYWSATSDATNPNDAWVVSFGSPVGGVDTDVKTDPLVAVWCVRGGSPGPSQY